MSIFNDNDIKLKSNEFALKDFCEKYIYGFNKGPWHTNNNWKGTGNSYNYYYMIELKAELFEKWNKYIFITNDNKYIYAIPSFVSWVDDEKLIVNCSYHDSFDNRKFIIHDYDGDSIDWIDLDTVISVSDIITINCPNLKLYKNKDILLSIEEKDIKEKYSIH